MEQELNVSTHAFIEDNKVHLSFSIEGQVEIPFDDAAARKLSVRTEKLVEAVQKALETQFYPKVRETIKDAQ